MDIAEYQKLCLSLSLPLTLLLVFFLSFVLRSGVEHQSFAHLVSPLGALPSSLGDVGRKNKVQADSAHDTGTDTLGRIMSPHAYGWSCFLFFHIFPLPSAFEAQPWLRASILPTSSPSPLPRASICLSRWDENVSFFVGENFNNKVPNKHFKNFLSSPKVRLTTARSTRTVFCASSLRVLSIRLVSVSYVLCCLVLCCDGLTGRRHRVIPGQCSSSASRDTVGKTTITFPDFIFGDSLPNSTTFWGS